MSSLFSAPSWATQSKPENDEDQDKAPESSNLFSHSRSFQAIQRERLEREKRQAEKAKERERRKQEKAEQKRQKNSVKRESTGDEGGGSSTKKRRITSDDMDKLLAEAGVSRSRAIDLGDSDEDEQQLEAASLPTRRSPRINRTRDMLGTARPRSNLGSEAHLESEGGLDSGSIAPRRPQAPEPEPESEEEYDSDPEIAELQRQARAKAKLKLSQNAPTPAVGTGIGTGFALDSSHLPTPPPADPPVQILITSPLPNTRPLICFRKLSQNLAPVREMWCSKQGFDESFSETIFLTHRGRRLWNVTTVQRLGIGVDASGNVFLEEDRTKTGVEKIHVEAMTKELFEEMKADRAKLARGDNSQYEVQEEEAANGAEDVESEEQSQQLHLTIKAKGKQDWKLKVKPLTKIAKIVKAAKKQFGIPKEQTAFLDFDGEHLDPESIVADTEVEDGDNVELSLGS